MKSLAEIMLEKGFSFYQPKDEKDLIQLHPMLGDNKVFMALRPKELLFTWYLACPCSPLRDLSRNERIMAACRKIWGAEAGEKKAEELRHGLSDKMREAEAAWKSYDIEDRIRQTVIAQQTIEKIRLQLDEDLGNSLKTDGEKDWAKVKNWMAAMQTGNQTIAMLVQQIERGGYGVVDGEEEDLQPGELAQHVLSRQ